MEANHIDFSSSCPASTNGTHSFVLCIESMNIEGYVLHTIECKHCGGKTDYYSIRKGNTETPPEPLDTAPDEVQRDIVAAAEKKKKELEEQNAINAQLKVQLMTLRKFLKRRKVALGERQKPALVDELQLKSEQADELLRSHADSQSGYDSYDLAMG